MVGVAHSLPSGAWAVLHSWAGVKVSKGPLAGALSPECHPATEVGLEACGDLSGHAPGGRETDRGLAWPSSRPSASPWGAF